jgi:hypothetical protein
VQLIRSAIGRNAIQSEESTERSAINEKKCNRKRCNAIKRIRNQRRETDIPIQTNLLKPNRTKSIGTKQNQIKQISTKSN